MEKKVKKNLESNKNTGLPLRLMENKDAKSQNMSTNKN